MTPSSFDGFSRSIYYPKMKMQVTAQYI